MQQFYSVKEVLNEKLKRRYEFTVKNDYLEPKVEEKLQTIAASTRMDGFRKGKVSPGFVRKAYGADIANEVVSQAVDEISSEFLKENKFEDIVASNVKVTAYPKVCSEESKSEDLVYELEFELMPEMPAIDPEGITIREIEVQVSEKDVDDFLEDLRANYPRFVPADDESRGISAGDQVTVSYHSMYRGKALRGGSAKGFTFVLGKESLLKEFEEQVTGMKKGESKEFKLQFPSDYAALHFAGKEVDMNVRIEDFRVRDNIADRETLASKCGFKDVDEMVKFANNGLSERYAKMSSVVAQRDLLDYMDKTYSVDVPEFVVSQEIARLQKELGGKESDESVDIAQEAAKRVKLGMLLMKVANDSGVVVETDDVLAFLRDNFAGYGGTMETALKLFRSSGDFRNHVKGKVLEDKVVRYIISKAKREKHTMSSQELKVLFESL